MKIAVTVVRILVGLLFLFSSVTFLLKLFPTPEMTGPIKTFNEGIAASGYLMYLIKITELLCGLALVIGRYVPLATVVIFPVTLNILLVHLFIAPEGLGVAIPLMLCNLFLAYAYRDRYRPMLAANSKLAA
jgi:uncharacterized membrane protein YphA (DoxX/SURF4 family)